MNHTTLVVSIALAAVLVVGVYATITQQAFAAVNLNSSKSNVYRVHQEQSVDADTINDPVTQASTISRDCSQEG